MNTPSPQTRISCSSEIYQNILKEIKNQTPVIINFLPLLDGKIHEPQIIFSINICDKKLCIQRQIDGMGYLRYDIQLTSIEDDNDWNGLVFIDPHQHLVECDIEYQNAYKTYLQYHMNLEHYVDIYHRYVTSSSLLSGTQLLEIAKIFFVANPSLGIKKIALHHVNQHSIIQWALKNGFGGYTNNDKLVCEKWINNTNKFQCKPGKNIYDDQYPLEDVIYDTNNKEIYISMILPL